MKKSSTLLLIIFVMVKLHSTNYYVDASALNDSGEGTSWNTAKKTIAAAELLTSNGDNIFIKSGTYDYSTTWDLKNLNYYGGFSGIESTVDERIINDLDGNGLIEKWEFSHPTIINFNISTDVIGLRIQSNGTYRNFNGFKITGSYTATTSNYQLINIGNYCLFSNNTISDITLSTTLTTHIYGQFLRMTGAPSTVSDCLIQNNSVTVTAGANATDYNVSPFIKLEAASGANRRLFANNVIRNNVINTDYSSSLRTSVANARGLIVSMDLSTVEASSFNAVRCNLIYNNDVTFIPGSSMTNANRNNNTSGLIYSYNVNTTTQHDSIVQNTVTNNKMTRIGTALYVGIIGSSSLPAHKVLNNVLFNNKKINDAGNITDKNILTSNNPTTTLGVLIANNVCSGGFDATVTENTIQNNISDLSLTNLDASKGAWFSQPSSTYGTGATGILTSRWSVGANSYLMAKGNSTLSGQTDISANRFANPPTVGAFEFFINYRSVGLGDWDATENWEKTSDGVNWEASTAFPDNSVTGTVTINSDHELTIKQNLSVSSVTISPGAKVTLNDGVTLSTNNIMLQNNASGTASFVDNRTDVSPSAIAGTVEQAITATNRNWYVGVPITGQTAAGITLSGAKIVQRNETLSRWDDVLSSTGLTAGVGYIAVASTSAGTATWTMNGNLNSGKVEVGLTYSGTSSLGYNLVGNPYPSYLNWEQVLNLNATNAALVQPTIWYRTATYNDLQSKFDYAFNTYNSAGRVATPTSTTGYIPPMQAFWVKANAAGTLTFTNAMRSHGNGSSNQLKAPQQNISKIIRLEVSNGINKDEAVLYFNVNALNAFDNYDSPKMFNNVASRPEIYTKAGLEKLVINGLTDVSDNLEIPIGFTTGTAGSFTLKATELANFDSNTRIFLRDKLADNTELELAPATEHTFSSDITSANESRFSLIFKAPSITTGVINPEKESVSVFVNAQNQIVINANAGSKYAIYNAVGQQIANGKTTSNSQTSNFKLLNGVYVVKVGNVTERIIIK